MNELTKRQRAAVEAVARHFSATWEEGEGPPDAHLTIAGERIAVEVTTLRQRIADQVPKPRLRFDRVALGLVRRLQVALNDSVPDGKTLIVTITAPIKMPAKTAAELEGKIRVDLGQRLGVVAARHTIHGNQIRVRLVKGGSNRASKVIGFVHNPESDAEALLDIVHSLIESIGARAGASPAFAGDRWLVLASDGRLANIETYRLVHSHLSMPADLKKILVVAADGRVETITG